MIHIFTYSVILKLKVLVTARPRFAKFQAEKGEKYPRIKIFQTNLRSLWSIYIVYNIINVNWVRYYFSKIMRKNDPRDYACLLRMGNGKRKT